LVAGHHPWLTRVPSSNGGQWRKAIIMADKGKGRDAGKAKKPKTPKIGHRPHEERQRQETLTAVAPVPGRDRPT
jgi:hypothetical protein